MKKTILLFLAICIFFGNPAKGQLNRLLNKVTKSVIEKPESVSGNTNKEPEPECACDQPELIVDLGGNLKLMYTELSITVRDDGAILMKDRTTSDYYIVKDGAAQGPVKAGDSRLAGFDIDKADAPEGNNLWTNNEYITRSGEKYLIKFNGKNYGPYAEINQFKVAKSKDKFAAMIVENVAFTQADMNKMNEEIKKAKTDQERMDLSMKYSQQMAQKMQQGGGVMNTLPKLVSNIAGVTFDPMRSMGGALNNSIKFDDILIRTHDKVLDLSNKVLVTINPEAQNSEDLFLNTGNTGYAWYTYGTLTFGDGKVISELFNPHLVKVNGQVDLAYMYYSPKTNAIMQCRMPF